MKKRILDMCCSGRQFWFDRENPDVVFCDIRSGSFELGDGRTCDVRPDVVADFRDLPFEDKSFDLAVFDPPHLKSIGHSSWTAKRFGKLTESWQHDLKAGFDEAARVLKPGGVLVFKWNEYEIPVKQVLALASNLVPLFGHRSGKLAKTHWVCFTKPV